VLIKRHCTVEYDEQENTKVHMRKIPAYNLETCACSRY